MGFENVFNIYVLDFLIVILGKCISFFYKGLKRVKFVFKVQLYNIWLAGYHKNKTKNKKLVIWLSFEFDIHGL